MLRLRPINLALASVRPRRSFWSYACFIPYASGSKFCLLHNGYPGVRGYCSLKPPPRRSNTTLRFALSLSRASGLAAIDDVVRQRHRRRARDAALAVHIDTFAGGHVL